MQDLQTFELIARRRRSVRAFLSQSVDRALIERAIEIASTTPSSCNTQPWRLHIVSGAMLEALGAALQNAAAKGVKAAPDVDSAAPYTGVFRNRQIDAAVQLFHAIGIERHDREGRLRSFLRNYAFFDAPHAAFVFLPQGGGLREAADCGKFIQTFMLALAAAGIGSCPQGSLSDYPAIVRDTLGLREDGRLLLGISFGYADENDNTARVRPKRATVDDIAQFHG